MIKKSILKYKVNNKISPAALMCLFLLIPLLLVILLSFLSVIVRSNRVLAENVYLISALDLIFPFINIFIYAVSFAFIVRALFERKRVVSTCAVFIAASALRYILSTLVSIIMYKTVSVTSLFSTLWAFLLDIAIMGIILIIAVVIRKKHKLETSSKIQKQKLKGSLIPDFSKPIDKCLFIAGVIWAAIRLVSLISYDIIFIITLGAPSANNVIWMLIYYLFAVLVCPVFYLIASATVKYISKND